MSTEVELVPVPEGLPEKIHPDKLAEIGGFILDGLSEDEACVLAGYPAKQLKVLKQNFEKVALYLEKKKIEFKRKHLKTINGKVGEKTSMWMLENVMPEQFGGKRKGADPGAVDALAAIINAVRSANNTIPVKIQDAEYTTKNTTGAEGRELKPESILI